MASELEKQRTRKENLLRAVIESHNKNVAEDKELRLRNRREMQQMLQEERMNHYRWKKEQERLANEGGWLSGMLQGAAGGASVGTAVNPGWGTLIGGVIGGVAGGVHGAVEGKQGVQEISPYVGAISQLAGSYAAAQDQKAMNQQLIDFYKQSGQAGQPAAATPGAASSEFPTSVEGGLSLGQPGPLTYKGGKPFALDYNVGGASQDPLSTDYNPEVSSMMGPPALVGLPGDLTNAQASYLDRRKAQRHQGIVDPTGRLAAREAVRGQGALPALDKWGGDQPLSEDIARGDYAWKLRNMRFQ